LKSGEVKKMAKEISCKSAGMDCPFMLRTESDDELVSFAQQHVKKVHKKDISKADVLKMAKKV
jgi:predicted small metal-binding protein